MPKFGRREAAGLAFFIGWIGSRALIEKVIGWDWPTFSYFLIGMILYFTVNGDYEREAEEQKQNNQSSSK